MLGALQSSRHLEFFWKPIFTIYVDFIGYPFFYFLSKIAMDAPTHF